MHAIEKSRDQRVRECLAALAKADRDIGMRTDAWVNVWRDVLAAGRPVRPADVARAWASAVASGILLHGHAEMVVGTSLMRALLLADDLAPTLWVLGQFDQPDPPPMTDDMRNEIVSSCIHAFGVFIDAGTSVSDDDLLLLARACGASGPTRRLRITTVIPPLLLGGSSCSDAPWLTDLNADELRQLLYETLLPWAPLQGWDDPRHRDDDADDDASDTSEDTPSLGPVGIMRRQQASVTLLALLRRGGGRPTPEQRLAAQHMLRDSLRPDPLRVALMHWVLAFDTPSDDLAARTHAWVQQVVFWAPEYVRPALLRAARPLRAWLDGDTPPPDPPPEFLRPRTTLGDLLFD